jgi:glycosyltransferase involved in cell wall biosynthesis
MDTRTTAHRRLVAAPSRIPEFRFLCVGGENREQDLAALSALGLDRHVLFVDVVADEELSVLYRNALALIYPSRMRALDCRYSRPCGGVPVVCSQAASLPEVGGDAAVYFDPTSVESLESALTRLVSGARDEIVQRGFRNVARFSWDRSTRALVDVYRGLADARPPS